MQRASSWKASPVVPEALGLSAEAWEGCPARPARPTAPDDAETLLNSMQPRGGRCCGKERSPEGGRRMHPFPRCRPMFSVGHPCPVCSFLFLLMQHIDLPSSSSASTLIFRNP